MAESSDTSPTGDPLIEKSEQADAERAAKAARLFDIRRLIGGLFLIGDRVLADDERLLHRVGAVAPARRGPRGLSVRDGAPAAPA